MQDLDPDGLEVNDAPREFDHTQNVELEAGQGKSEMWTSTNTPELESSNGRFASLVEQCELPASDDVAKEEITPVQKQAPTEGDLQFSMSRSPEEDGRAEASPSLEMSPSWQHGSIWFDPSDPRQVVYTAIPSNPETDDR